MSTNSVNYDDLVRVILALDRSLEQLHPRATAMGVGSPVHREWFSLLRRKLVPQLARRSHLVISIMGGTNTGKSVIFNLLAGEKISASESEAAGTKHPVLLLPSQTDPESVLPFYFEEFERRPWNSAHDPVEPSTEHRLFWTHGKNVPEKLILVDTPDIDSDVEVNWERARRIRQVSDVLIGVITPQKYNDAVVKRFFREAVEAGKPVVLLWNMAFEEQFKDVWSRWIAQFSQETGVKPLAVFATPHDPQATKNLTLPVYDIGQDGMSEPTPVNLQNYLNVIRFDELKIQALLGAIKRLDAPDSGIGEYLDAIEATAGHFDEAARTFRDRENLAVEWPSIPKTLLAEEVGKWCNTKRPGVLQNVNAVYGTVLYPVQKMWNGFRERWNAKKQTVEQREELAAVLKLVEKTVDQLKSLVVKTENPVLKAELDKLLLGEQRKSLRDKSEKIHASLPPKTDERIREEVFAILDRWVAAHPNQWSILHKLDVASLGAHALLTTGALITFGVLGVGAVLGSGGIVLYLLLAGGGEAVLKILGEEVRLAIAELKVEIQEKYARWRKEIFLDRFEQGLWHELLAKLDTGAAIVTSEPFLETRRIHQHIRKMLSELKFNPNSN